MKKLYTIALFLISVTVFSQTPYAINYQGVARYANGDPIVGPIGVSVTIHAGSATGPSTFTEQHAVNTNQFGIFEVKIGGNTTGGLSNTNIGWGTNKFFLGVAIDPSGGTNYGPEISNQQFVSVPYALYAEKSGGGSTGTLTASPNVTVSSAGTNSFNINVRNYVAGANVTITPLTGNDYQINVGNTSTSVPSGIWTQTLGAAILTNSLDNIGIGTSGPAAKLEVNANPFSTNNAIAAYAQGGNGVLALTSSTLISAAAVSAQNSGSGFGVFGSAVSTNSTVSGVYGKNTGAGSGVYGLNTSGASGSSAHGVAGETNAQNAAVGGVYGANFGSGPGVYGWQGSLNGGPGVQGIANSSVSPGVYGLSNNGSPGVYGEIVSGNGLSTAHGVYGKTNSSNALVSGVYAINSGAGSGVFGQTSSSVLGSWGVYGRNNGVGGGVFGETAGGVALRGTIPSGTVAGSNNLALLLENGHIKAVGPNPGASVITNSITGFTYSIVPNPTNSDVRGVISTNSLNCTGCNPGTYIDVNVVFAKPYSAGPTVVVCPSEPVNTKYSYIITNMTNLNFTVRIVNNTAGAGGSNNGFRFSYMVME